MPDSAAKRATPLTLPPIPPAAPAPAATAFGPAGGPAAAKSHPSIDGNTLEAVERRHILAVLEKNGGNRAATAAELGISLRKLYYRLGQYQREGLFS